MFQSPVFKLNPLSVKSSLNCALGAVVFDFICIGSGWSFEAGSGVRVATTIKFFILCPYWVVCFVFGWNFEAGIGVRVATTVKFLSLYPYSVVRLARGPRVVATSRGCFRVRLALRTGSGCRSSGGGSTTMGHFWEVLTRLTRFETFAVG